MPGGIGFSERLYEVHDTLLGAAYEHVMACACEDGCPSCVGVGPDDQERAITKTSTLHLLDALAHGVLPPVLHD